MLDAANPSPICIKKGHTKFPVRLQTVTKFHVPNRKNRPFFTAGLSPFDRTRARALSRLVNHRQMHHPRSTRWIFQIRHRQTLTRHIASPIVKASRFARSLFVLNFSFLSCLAPRRLYVCIYASTHSRDGGGRKPPGNYVLRLRVTRMTFRARYPWRVYT